MQTIKIAVVGDSLVGKTSLISAFVREEWSDDVPEVLPELILPADLTTDHVQTIVVDTRNENMRHLKEQLYEADAVVLLYTGDLNRCDAYWMPLIQNNVSRVDVPVVVVHSKVEQSQQQKANDAQQQFMRTWKQVETCLEASAKDMVNVAEVFYYCTKAVLYPSAPLWQQHQMSPNCKAALTRIFKLSDRDCDGQLSDAELNHFQMRVFDSPLQQHELEGVKDVVRMALSQQKAAITLEAFLYLHTLFIQRGRLETLWRVLLRYGYYGKEVQLRPDYLLPRIKVKVDDATELSPRGYQFLIDEFRRFDKNHQGSLDQEQVKQLFSTAPSMLWTNDQMSVRTQNGQLTLQGYLALWSMYSLLDYKLTLNFLSYLGYNQSEKCTTQECIKVVPQRYAATVRRKSQRSTFHCLVVGAKGSGKSALCRQLVDAPFLESYDPLESKTKKDGYGMLYVNAIDVQGAEKYLIMRELDVDETASVLVDAEKMSTVDFVVFCYDTHDSNSFAYIVRLLDAVSDKFQHACMVVGTKSDMPSTEQLYLGKSINPVDYCTKILKIQTPNLVSAKTMAPQDYSVYLEVLQACLFVSGVQRIPSLPTHGLSRRSRSQLKWWLVAGVASTLTGVAGYYIWYKGYSLQAAFRSVSDRITASIRK